MRHDERVGGCKIRMLDGGKPSRATNGVDATHTRK